MKKNFYSFAAVCALIAGAACVFARAAEHPGSEHPTSNSTYQPPSTSQAQEHPTQTNEHPVSYPKASTARPMRRLKSTRIPSKAAPKSAAEHPPEHPDHPKHDRRAAKRSVSIKDVARAVRRYVRDDSKMKGGYFLVYDKKAGKMLPLTLSKVHEDRLAAVSPNRYFVCADFVTPKGKIYDLDLFMVGRTKSSLKATELSIHKENGKARYTWIQRKGFWVKKPLK